MQHLPRPWMLAALRGCAGGGAGTGRKEPDTHWGEHGPPRPEARRRRLSARRGTRQGCHAWYGEDAWGGAERWRTSRPPEVQVSTSAPRNASSSRATPSSARADRVRRGCGDHARAPVDQRRVELERARAGADLGIGVAAPEDAADPDQRQPAPVRRWKRPSCSVERKNKGAPLNPPASSRRRPLDLRPRSRGVADDQAVDVARERHLGNPCLGVRLQIRSDLEQQQHLAGCCRRGALRASTSAASSSSSRPPCRSACRRRRVRGRDVDREIVDQRGTARAGRRRSPRPGPRRRDWRRCWRRAGPARFRPASRARTASRPSLLKPIRLISACCARRRNSRGWGCRPAAAASRCRPRRS